MQETSLCESSHYTESQDEKLHNMCPNNQLSTEKSGGHCTLFAAMLHLLHSVIDK